MDLTSILGSINNQIINITDSGGLITNVKIVWDIPYIVNAIIFLLSLNFIYKCILALIRKVGD